VYDLCNLGDERQQDATSGATAEFLAGGENKDHECAGESIGKYRQSLRREGLAGCRDEQSRGSEANLNASEFAK
jgi:hypothetical protein